MQSIDRFTHHAPGEVASASVRRDRHAGDAAGCDGTPAEILRVVQQCHAADDRVAVVGRDDVLVGRAGPGQIDRILTAEGLPAQFELGWLVTVAETLDRGSFGRHHHNIGPERSPAERGFRDRP